MAHTRADVLKKYEQMTAKDLVRFADVDPASLSQEELADIKEWLPTLISNLVYDTAEQSAAKRSCKMTPDEIRILYKQFFTDTIPTFQEFQKFMSDFAKTTPTTPATPLQTNP